MQLHLGSLSLSVSTVHTLHRTTEMRDHGATKVRLSTSAPLFVSRIFSHKKYYYTRANLMGKNIDPEEWQLLWLNLLLI